MTPNQPTALSLSLTHLTTVCTALRVVPVLVFLLLVGATTARPEVMIPYTINVEYQGQPAPGVTLLITISDGVASTRSVRYAKTNAEGSFSSTASFACDASDRLSWGIGAVKILEDGSIEPGGGVGGSTSCQNNSPAPPLNLAISRLGTYDRHNAGKGDCNTMVGRPINVTNGNMFLSQQDYLLPGNGPRIGLTRRYNSIIGAAGYFGYGWTSDVDERLIVSCTGPFQCNLDYMLHLLPDGRIHHYRQTQPGVYEPLNAGDYARVQRYADSTKDVFFKDGRVHRFDIQGNLIWKKDRNGNQTTTTYTNNGLQFTITDPHGRSLTVVRDPTHGRISRITDAMGTVATYGYDPGNSNLLRTVTYSDGFQNRYEYDTTSIPGRVLLTAVRDALDNVVEAHQYDAQGRAITSEIHDGAEKYDFDYSNWDSATPHTIVRHKKNPADTFIQSKFYFQKDRYRNVVTKTEGACECGGSGSEVREMFYDDSANLTRAIDANGNQTTFSYDDRGNMISKSDMFGTQTFTYNTVGQMLTHRDRVDSQNPDPNVFTAKLTYDSNGNLTTYADALGNVTTLTYPAVGSRGLPESITDARNNRTQFRWSADSGLLEEVEDPYAKTTTYTYDPRGRVKMIRDPLSQVVTYNYFDDSQRMVELIYPNLDKLTYKYDVRRLPESFTDERGKVTTYEFDPQNRLRKITSPLGHAREMTYDLMSNLASYKDPIGNVTDFRYDDFDRLQEVVYPAASAGQTRLRERFEYDALGRMIRHLDTADRQTQYLYEESTRTNKVINPAGEVTTATYDQRFQTLELRNALDQVYAFTYDRMGRVLSETGAGGMRTYLYNEIGGLARRIDYAGLETTYSYDSLNRLTDIAYLPAAGSGLPLRRSNYSYDELSRLTAARNETGSVAFSYDSRGRIKSTTDVFGHLLEYEYERTPTVNQKRLKFDGAPYAIYNFDDSGRLANIVNASDNSAISFAYDPDNRMVSRGYPNGVMTSYEYDNIGRLLRLRDFTTAATIFDRQYLYNSGNQIEGINDLTDRLGLAYDLTDRLTAVSSEAGRNERYEYDSVGNRLSSHRSNNYDYGPYNRLLASDTGTYAFDANGNTVEKREGTGSWAYKWDHENRLTEVSSRKKKVTYKYDALGRRVQRSGPSGNEATKFIYDGQDVLVDEETRSLTKYLNGPGIDAKLRMQSGTKVNYFLADHLGSTNALTDRFGSAASFVSYDSFGDPTGTLGTRYGFAGREYDSFSGFYYYRVRWYDPNIGRFISEDPIGIAGGANQYSYVSNNPMNNTDPLGLYEIDVHYYLTYYLAMKTGCFTEIQIRAIANGTQLADEVDAYAPDLGRTYQNSEYHALNARSAPGMPSANLAFRVTPHNYLAFGRYLHYYQDTYSHDGYPDSYVGHAGALHYYDKTDSDPVRAMRMAGGTWAALKDFARMSGCKCDPIWTAEMQQTVWDFVRTSGANFGALNTIDSVGDIRDFGISNPTSYLDRKIRILGVPRR